MKKLLLALVAGVLVLQSTAALPQARTPVVIRFAHGFSPQSFTGRSIDEWAKLVESKSGGSIKVQIFPAAQLYDMQSLPQALSTGNIDAGANMTPYSTQIVPAVGIWALPSLLRNDEDAIKVASSKVATRLSDMFEAKNLHIVSWWPFGGVKWFGNKPLVTPADVRGLKVRSSADVISRVIEAMGGTPVFIEANEVYAALQRGMIDANTISTSSIIDRKLIEVTKYGNDISAGYAMLMLTFNKNAWDAYSPQTRAVIVEAADEIRKKVEIGVVADEDTKLKMAVAKGLKFHRATPEEQAIWRKAALPVWDDYRKSNGAAGAELLDTVLEVTGQK